MVDVPCVQVGHERDASVFHAHAGKGRLAAVWANAFLRAVWAWARDDVGKFCSGTQLASAAGERHLWR
eukprot:4961197-Alexandrium_andersonii.AAC.1